MPPSRLIIDPELKEALDCVPVGPSGAMFDLTNLPATRDAVRASAEELPDDGSILVDEHVVSRSDGPPLPLRVLRPAVAHATLPALLWFHGGGQVLGSAAQDDAYLKPLSAQTGCAVISVDYRLAPEAPAPAAAEDGFEAYMHVLDNVASLGIDPLRVGLGGASGGGGIAAVVAVMIRDRDAPAPLLLSLNYPMLDDRNVTKSSREIVNIGIWDRSTNALAWQAVLGDRAGSEDVPPYSVPARVSDLSGLPPTFIAVAELDVFRDEDLDFARRLRAAGVPVELHLYPGAYHAWDVIAPKSQLAYAFFAAWYGFLARCFGTHASVEQAARTGRGPESASEDPGRPPGPRWTACGG